MHLGVPPEELDCIESRVATPENCFTRVLDRFLFTHAHTGTDDRRRCTEVIIKALRFPAIAKGNLSRDIKSGKISKLRIISTAINCHCYYQCKSARTERLQCYLVYAQCAAGVE